jgi:hypothetical protein
LIVDSLLIGECRLLIDSVTMQVAHQGNQQSTIANQQRIVKSPFKDQESNYQSPTS